MKEYIDFTKFSIDSVREEIRFLSRANDEYMRITKSIKPMHTWTVEESEYEGRKCFIIHDILELD